MSYHSSVRVPAASGGRGIVFDYAERLFVALLSGAAVLRFIPTLAGAPFNAVLLTSELAVVAFVIFRRPTERVDLSPFAVLVALGGTVAGLMVRPGGVNIAPDWAGGLVMVLGGLLSISAKVSLNRSFGITAANRGVKREGPYRFMRHPMYAGYILTQIGFLLANATAWNVLVYVIGWTLQLLRIVAEERVLREDAAYRDYATAVPFRLAPGLY